MKPFWGSPGPAGDEDPVWVPLTLITATVAFIVMTPLILAWAAVAAVVAAVAAAAIGAPVLFMARRLRLRGFWLTSALGALVPGLAFWIGEAVIERRFPPHVISTAYFGCAMLIGAAAGGIYATVFDQLSMSPRAVRVRVILIVTIAAVLPLAVAAARSRFGLFQ
jgi:hypothetical protein